MRRCGRAMSPTTRTFSSFGNASDRHWQARVDWCVNDRRTTSVNARFYRLLCTSEHLKGTERFGFMERNSFLQMSTARRLALVAALAAGASFLGVTPAQAAANDGNITNSGSLAFGICRNAASETACGSQPGSLSAGQNSRTKYGWADTDMILISANCRLEKYSYYAGTYSWRGYASAGSANRYIKIPGSNGVAEKFRQIC